ncbi:MAG: YdeI/OmpD-associated family protein [bacterium]|nr:YdeI/OmpD-associated family protein [bacterium]
MSRARTAVQTEADGPAVLRFKARIVQQPHAKDTAATVLDIPLAVSKQLRAMDTLEGTINGHAFRAVLEPGASGGLWLRVNKAMQGGANAAAGDTVQLAVLGPEPEPTVPSDLRVELNASPAALLLWTDLTLIGRLDYIRWIDAAKKPETRARRITLTVEQLAEGKRRPCCVNVYDYMLRRVGQD